MQLGSRGSVRSVVLYRCRRAHHRVGNSDAMAQERDGAQNAWKGHGNRSLGERREAMNLPRGVLNARLGPLHSFLTSRMVVVKHVAGNVEKF